MPQQPDARLKDFARMWLHGPLPAELLSDISVILELDEYTPEKRVHQIVWQALKWGMENTVSRPADDPLLG